MYQALSRFSYLSPPVTGDPVVTGGEYEVAAEGTRLIGSWVEKSSELSADGLKFEDPEGD